MSNLVPSADELTHSEIGGAPARCLSAVDAWIGSRVRIRRTCLGMTERELSAKLKCDRGDLVAFEAGEQRINARLLFRIAEVMNVQPDYFFRGYPTPPAG